MKTFDDWSKMPCSLLWSWNRGLLAKECKDYSSRIQKSQRNRFPPGASRARAPLLTHWFQLSATNLGPLTSRTVREYMCVVVSHRVCGNLLQQPQETITGLFLHVFVHKPLHEKFPVPFWLAFYRQLPRQHTQGNRIVNRRLSLFYESFLGGTQKSRTDEALCG